ncbi:MAG: hypothetical protein AAF828_01485, partial [Bacteroidota bacterium]
MEQRDPTKFPMRGTPLEIGSNKGIIPESWNDLPRPLLLKCFSDILATGYEVGLEPQEIMPYQRIGILLSLMNMQLNDLKKWQQDCIKAGINEQAGEAQYFDELTQVLNEIEFAFEEVEDDDEATKYRIKLGLTNCPYPSID